MTSPSAISTNVAVRQDLLTLAELCQWLKVPKATVYDWTHTGFIPHYKLGRLLRFDPREVETWLQRRKIQGRPARSPGGAPRSVRPLDLG